MQAFDLRKRACFIIVAEGATDQLSVFPAKDR